MVDDGEHSVVQPADWRRCDMHDTQEPGDGPQRCGREGVQHTEEDGCVGIRPRQEEERHRHLLAPEHPARPKMTATAPATKNGIVRRSILHTQNMADNLLGRKRLAHSAAAMSGTPTM